MNLSSEFICQIGNLYDQGMEAEDIFDMLDEQFLICEIKAAINKYMAASDAAENDEDDPNFDPFRGTCGAEEEVEYLSMCAEFNL